MTEHDEKYDEEIADLINECFNDPVNLHKYPYEKRQKVIANIDKVYTQIKRGVDLETAIAYALL